MSSQPDIIATESLYESREKIYPREISGRFQYIRNATILSFLIVYYALAWMQWDGHQAVLFDLPERKFYIFSLIFWPQDFYFLALLLIICALSLFFFTAIAGRLWCGYTCPQTVWTNAFVWIERWIEGNRRTQIKLDKSPWSQQKLIKKIAKHSLWIVFALVTGFTFVGYFTPIRELAIKFSSWTLSPWETFWVFFYGFATWGNAGFLREQVCIYMCPYARFQSVMFDSDTLLVSYDSKRGEPRIRGKKRRQNESSVGDCVDCGLCVQVCPTGIDIREGLQYECIGCAACIDACDQVMDSVDLPKGLIRYTTEHALDNRVTRMIRPRVVVYASILTILVSGFFVGLNTRADLAFDIIRDRNALYRVVDDMHVENVYTLKLMNKSNEVQFYSLSVSGIADARVVAPELTRSVAAGDVANIPLRVIAPISNLQVAQTITLSVSEIKSTRSGDTVSEKTRFFGPQ